MQQVSLPIIHGYTYTKSFFGTWRHEILGIDADKPIAIIPKTEELNEGQRERFALLITKIPEMLEAIDYLANIVATRQYQGVEEAFPEGLKKAMRLLDL